MHRYILCVAALSMGASATLAQSNTPTGALTKAQCENLWSQAMGSDTGDLAMNKASPYAKDFKSVDLNGDGKLQSKEWMDGCDKGLIKTSEAAPSNQPANVEGGKTSDRTPEGAKERTPGAGSTGAAGTGAGKTPEGTSDRTPSK
jgi:hypothetical protein